MEFDIAIDRLSALAHEGRLAVFRTLVQMGSEGIAAGDLADKLGLQPSTLSAQLNVLSVAKMVRKERHGRSIVYFANLEALNGLMLFLIEDCCEGRNEVCSPLMDAIQRVQCC